MSLLLQTAKAILHEVDGIEGGYDPNSYIPPHLVEALRGAIELEEFPKNQVSGLRNYSLHPAFQKAIEDWRKGK